MDDIAALSRLYPVTAQNLANFPGKQIFAQQTARIHGSVYFSDAAGLAAQPMQGVDVVARWIDPSTGFPSRAYVASCVSGFLFVGNVGNVVTGYTDGNGNNYDRFGSDDPTLEGFFDLAGLQIPSGTVGAGPSDLLQRISGNNSATPVGGQAAIPFTVRVVQSDGITPVSGASIQFTASPALAFSACGGATNCTVLTDQSGYASTFITVLSAGVMTVTATLAPASYSSPQQVVTTLLGTTSPLDLSLTMPRVWIAQGATLSLPLTARLLSNGTPLIGSTVNYQITQGAANLSANSAQTGTDDFASVSLQLNSASSGVQVSVCAAPANTPCQIFTATVVPLSSLQIQPVAGTLQILASGQPFQPVVVRVTDSASPPDPVLGANVLFQSYVVRVPLNQPIVWTGEAGISRPGMPVILAAPLSSVQSDVNGIAAFTLTTTGISGDVAILGSASAGNASLQFAAQQLGP